MKADEDGFVTQQQIADEALSLAEIQPQKSIALSLCDIALSLRKLVERQGD
jgi:hypothetical protein